MATRRRAAAKPQVEEEEAFEEIDELDELEDPEDDDLEELEDDTEEDDEEPAPAPRKTAAKKTTAKAAAKKAAPAPASSDGNEFDSNWLAAYVSEETGQPYDSRGIRMLLRKLAKDGLLAREIGTDRSRYTFPKGANDAIVRQVVKLVSSGQGAAIKREGLAAVKAKPTATKKAAAPAKKSAPAPAAKKVAPTTRRRRSAE